MRHAKVGRDVAEVRGYPPSGQRRPTRTVGLRTPAGDRREFRLVLVLRPPRLDAADHKGVGEQHDTDLRLILSDGRFGLPTRWDVVIGSV